MATPPNMPQAQPRSSKKGLWIALGVIAVLIITAIAMSNKFVKLEEGLNQKWAQVENQYQRRLDLIPNLVETVKGYASHESTTLQGLTEARTGLSDAYNKANALGKEQPADEAALDNYSNTQQQLNRALSIYVNAVQEAYPDLKANEQFNNLMTQLEGTENRIATERGRYTEAVQEYNVAVRRFPASIFASIFGYSAKPQFKAEEGAASAPKVEF